MPVQLDDDDKIGATALIVRILRIQTERTRADEARKAANARYSDFDSQWNKAREAFAAYGFNVADKDLWDQVKAALGQDNWNQAYDRAKAAGPLTQRTPDEEKKETPPPAKAEEAEKEEEEEESAAEQSADEHVESEQTGATARDIVLEELRKAGDAGRKAADLRQVITRAIGREIHEKTAGMTLYRLSRDKLVRRVGRTWFIVPPKAETVNPGVAAPGSK